MVSTDTHSSNESLRYLPDEITVPNGFAVEDFDWTAFTWVLRNGEFYPKFAQFILAPGVLLMRTGHEDVGTWRKRAVNPHPEVFKTFRNNPEENLMAVSAQQTERILDGGYERKVSPVIFTMDQKDYPLWPTVDTLDDLDSGGSTTDVPVRTLGDALATRSPDTLRDVVNASIKAVKPFLKAR